VNVLITDGENRSSLAVTRSLGRYGYNVFVTGLESNNISASSKYCSRSFKTPDPLKDGIKYSDTIVDIVRREKINIIVPMTEQSIYQLNRVRDELPHDVILACPHQEKMDQVSNKFKLFEMANALGIPIPETIFVNGLDDFLEKESQITTFPVVVKPAFSKIADGDELISAGVMYASDRDGLKQLYDTKKVLCYPSLIQEMIVGEGTGLFTLFDQDRHLALFSHRRLLEKPPSGGVSVMSESIPLDPEMVKSAEKLLSSVGWQGVAMVEFKRDVRDGKAKLMEINGRFWGSLQLAVASGIDFPVLCLEYYQNRKPTALPAYYTVGHRLKWHFGILDHLLIRFKKGGRMYNLPPATPTGLQVAWEFINFGDSNSSSDVFDMEDLKPLVAEISAYVINLMHFKS